jgi:hypothetical protein
MYFKRVNDDGAFARYDTRCVREGAYDLPVMISDIGQREEVQGAPVLVQ